MTSLIKTCLGEKRKAVFLTLAIACYLASLALPAISIESHDPIFGAEVLLTAWMGVFFGEYAWFSNVAFIAALVAFGAGRHRLALASEIIAILLSLGSTQAKYWYLDERGIGIPIVALGTGFYVWTLSLWVLFLGAVTEAGSAYFGVTKRVP